MTGGVPGQALSPAPALSPLVGALWDLGIAVTIASYVVVAIAAILLYEAVRGWVKAVLRKRFERNLRQWLDAPDLYRQRFKFTNKLVIKHQLLADPEIHAKILEYAQREGQDIERVRERVDTYIDEIVPNFSLVTYFKIGYPIARAIVHSLYDPVVDQERRRLIEHLPDNASPVFVMNHRSNFDFVLLSYILAGKVSISYAVGEWARVWPLEHLFKSFGSYFVRRGYKEDLYHKVLERYVQLIARNGVTQAVFPEGGLTRDGHLMRPKLGLINWLSKVEAERDFDRDLVFVPVGVNYDWVLEDDNLVKEARGDRRDTGFWRKAYVVVVGPFMLAGLLLANGARFVAGRRKLHGYSSLSFAEPIVLKDWARQQGVHLGSCTADERRALIARFGDHLIQRIGDAVPATPATLLAVALLDEPRQDYGFQDLVQCAYKVREELERKGVPIVTGSRFQKYRDALLDVEHPHAVVERPAELDEIEGALVRHEEVEELVHFAVDVLRRNRLLTKRKRRYAVRPGADDHLRYYANSLAHRLGRSYHIGQNQARHARLGREVTEPGPNGPTATT